ncbi:MAG: hypothetical protein HZA93_26450 [Verrucomicrobia bacterium]|nr:hypothetical protein [Verrucomicrobiota bacterium]
MSDTANASKNHPLGRHLVTLGTLDSTLVTPREVFRGAILAGASALVVAHNHPSGDRMLTGNDALTIQADEFDAFADVG